MEKSIFILDFALGMIPTTKIGTGISSVDVAFVPSKKSYTKSHTSQNLGLSCLLNTGKSLIFNMPKRASH